MKRPLPVQLPVQLNTVGVPSRIGFSIPLVSMIAVLLLAPGWTAHAADLIQPLKPFLTQFCADCHSGDKAEGGLTLGKLGTDLNDAATFAVWERLYDRVQSQEMPPKDADQPSQPQRERFVTMLEKPLLAAHRANKGTVLRRLNRREYQNTLNDLFGTQLDLEGMLPEDGRSHEFDNVGAALGISVAHLQQYLEAARLVYDTSVAKTILAPKPRLTPANFRESEIASSIGKTWKRLEDGAIVRFEGGGYPSGLLRNSGAPVSGRYRVTITGYAYQSDQPIVCSVGGESYTPGSDKPVYNFISFPPVKPTTIEFETWIEKHDMLVLEPRGIALPQKRPEQIEDYEGPGFAFVSGSIEGPLFDEFPSRGHQLIFEGIDRREIEPRNPQDKKRDSYKPKFEIASTNESADAQQSIQRLATRAWRRPVRSEEIGRYVQLFENERAQDSTFEEALGTAITALFVSPNFLYLQEEPGRLDDFAVANRLSLFLTRSVPDQSLRILAVNKQLTQNPKIVRQQTERLLTVPHFDRFLTDFTETWLNLREMDFTAPDRTLFPEFDPYLRFSMPRETKLFLRELIEANLPVKNIVKSDFAMLNGRLAEHYGLPSVSGPKIRKVQLPPDSLRGGFLSQASVLKVTANGTNTSPVVRGVWVMDRILNQPPKPPPPGIAGVEPDIRGAATLRQLLDKHRDSQSCNVCHRTIDPPGFALECFNPIGGYRQHFRSLGSGERVETTVKGRGVNYRRGQQVDGSGETADGLAFSNFQQFRDHLAENDAALAKALLTKLLTFATGREMGFSDRIEIADIVQQSAADEYRIRDLILRATSSDIFLSK
ncbi:MAG: hypothetical protein ACI9G1_002460 [Pirellulaceae bacterium]|jgi:hypothetical protein